MRHFKTGALLKDCFISIVIAAVLFVGFELVVRTWFPQKLRTTFIGGTSLGIKDPAIGHLNQPNAHALVEGPEFTVTYQVNEQGFRDKTLYSAAKPEDTTRILLLGDSFTFGAANSYEDIWPVLVENRLREDGHKVELIKAGVPAFDTRNEVLFLEKYYEKYRPDIVAFVFLPNDLFTNTPISDNPGDTSQQRDTGIRKARDKKSTLHSLTLIKRLLMSSDQLYTQLYLLTSRRAYYETDPNAEVAKQFLETDKLFTRASKFCSDKGCEFMVFSIPQQFQVLAQAKQIEIDGVDPAAIDQTFQKKADESGYRWLPLLPELTRVYKQEGHVLYFRNDGHLNPDGNKVAASFIQQSFSDTLEKR